MRKCLILVAIGLAGPARLFAQQPAAVLGLPTPAASLATPTAYVGSFKPVIRGAAPTNDPLKGDYSPAAKLGPIASDSFGPNVAPEAAALTPEERYNLGLPSVGPSPSPVANPVPSPGPSPGPRPSLSFGADPVDSSRDPGPATPRFESSHSFFGEAMSDAFNNHVKGLFDWDHLFQSDHCFDDLISPVSNPFFAEDPRSLTELRPIFIFQTMPSSQYLYHTGNIEWYGVQARLAVTDRLSFVLNKFGGISINPGSDSPVGGESGFSEIWIGPKYTWYRDDQAGLVAAAGLTFQIPTGSANVYQDTSGVTLAPYANFAQSNIGKTSWGAFNVMDTLGFAFATSPDRSNYVYNSFHVDFNVANWNRIYPLIELNWQHYIRNGNERPLGFEGQDLANVGSQADGHDSMTMAIGLRYKLSEAIQFGGAVSLPLWNNSNDLEFFRLTLDMIWRY
jgi:hypothetical protein